MGIMLPAIILCFEFFQSAGIESGIKWFYCCFKRLLPFLFLFLLYLLLRSIALNGNIYHSSASDNLFQRVLPMFSTFSDYTCLLLFPFNLNTIYIVRTPSSFFDAEILLFLLFLLLILFSVLKLKQNRKEYLFGILWFFITLFPVSNIIPFSTIVKAEHFLYLPSVGFSVALNAILLLCANKLNIGKIAYLIIAVALVIPFSVLTYQRNFVWKNELTLFSDQVLKSPLSATAHNNLGLAYKLNNELESAKKEFNKAKKIAPDMHESYTNLGNIFLNSGDMKPAMEEYIKAVRINPSDAYVHNNLGVTYAKTGRIKEALNEFTEASLLNPLYPSPYINLGNAYAAMKEFDKAVELLKKAIAIDPFADNSAHYLLGMVYRDLREVNKAVEELKKAVKVNGENLHTLIQLAELYRISGNPDDALYYYSRALALEPDNAGLKHKIDLLKRK